MIRFPIINELILNQKYTENADISAIGATAATGGGNYKVGLYMAGPVANLQKSVFLGKIILDDLNVCRIWS